MEQVFAHFNHGRWIAICPRCQAMGIVSAAEVRKTEDRIFVCPEEFPGTQAKMLIAHPQRKGAFLSVPDDDARTQARNIAIDAGNSYIVICPPERPEIERILRFRPRYAQNWSPGTTMAELRDENIRNGVKNA